MRPALLVSTCFGCGYFPYAPGTVASAIIVLLCFALDGVGGWQSLILLTIVFSILGLAMSGRAARELNEEDPGCIVIDEAAGMALATVPATGSVIWFAVAFVGFRVLDIWKPGPVRMIERIGGSTGIMGDDLMAGGAVAIAIWLARFWVSG